MTRRLTAAAFILLGLTLIGVSAAPRSDAIPPVAIDQLGLAPNHSEAAAIVAAQTPRFLLVGDAAAEDNSKKNVRLWEPMLALRGDHFPNVPQQIGDCVSWGAANAVNYLQAVQLTRGPPDAFEFAPADPPYIYGTSRITIGAKHGSKFRGDGSVGAYAAEALRDCGCLKATHPQCPPYNGDRAKEWGAKGPPDWALEAAKRYTVETIAQVNTADDVRDAVCHGFPVTIASNWGTRTIRSRDGRNVASHDANWPHQMCVIAYDGTAREPYWYVLNSWGPTAHPAPLQNEPPGGFWIDRKSMNYIASQGDCWALSGFEGFPAEELDWDQLLHRTRSTVGAVAPPPPQLQEPRIMSSLVLFAGLVSCSIGIGLLMRGNARRMSAAALILALTLVSSSPVSADEPPLNFAAAETRSALVATNPPTKATVEPLNWSQALSPLAPTGGEGPGVRGESGTPPALNWSACEGTATTSQPTKPHPQALVFIRSRNCSDCDKVAKWIKTNVAPVGWNVTEATTTDPAADFVLVDVLKDQTLQNQYAIRAVPTIVYIDKQGRESTRFEGFSPPRSLTAELNRLR